MIYTREDLTKRPLSELTFSLKEIESKINIAANILRYFRAGLDNGKVTDMDYSEIQLLVNIATDLIDVCHEDALAWCDAAGLRLRVRWVHARRGFALEAIV